MSATMTRKPKREKRTTTAFPPATWEIVDALRTQMVFSVVRAERGFVVEPGRVSGALVTFTDRADTEPAELAAGASYRLRQVDGYGDVSHGAVTMDDYDGGQALYVAGKVGAALRVAEMLGCDWPAVGCLSAWLGYPEWLVEVAVNEYRSQRVE
jgi:hypothetical protein